MRVETICLMDFSIAGTCTLSLGEAADELRGCAIVDLFDWLL
jgi:hypothetical protein